MTSTSASRRRVDPGRPAVLLPRVSFCYDCCCGTARKHPEVDHDALRAELRDGLRHAAVVTRSACLDACADSNVIVVSPSPLGRRDGAKPVWLRRMLTPALIEVVIGWVADGGPGVAALPAGLRSHRMKRPAGRT